MAYKDLREFMAALEAKGLLRRIKTEVDARFEITEITDRVSKEQGAKNTALLFENVKGYDMPVLTNALGSMERMAMGLGVKNLDQMGERVRQASDITQLFPGPGAGFMEKLSILPKLSEMSGYFPKTVKKAPCQEVVLTGDQVDLTKIPVLTCWPGDGGPFVTLPMVASVDPVSNITNLGMYRLQVFDKNTTGMHWHRHKDGARHYAHYEATVKRM